MYAIYDMGKIFFFLQKTIFNQFIFIASRTIIRTYIPGFIYTPLEMDSCCIEWSWKFISCFTKQGFQKTEKGAKKILKLKVTEFENHMFFFLI